MTLKRFLKALFLITLFPLIAEENDMKNTEFTYDLHFMAYGDSYEGEDYEKFQNIIDAEKKFLKRCEKVQRIDGLSGTWVLVDSNGSRHKYCNYSLSSTIEASYYNDFIVIKCFDRNSNIYRNEKGQYFIWANWMNIVRMIELKDGKLYFYITKDNLWVLDPIHNNGEYFFVKDK